MVGAVTSRTSGDKPHVLPAFLSKMYEMVDDPSSNHLISWGSTSETFIVWNTEDFSSHVLSKYFTHNNFSNFIRQLNLYGFKKVDSRRWEFANKVGFVRGEPQLLKNIHPKRQISPKIGAPPLTYHERFIYRGEVEKLKREKQLQFELLDNYDKKQLEINRKKYAMARTYQGVLKKQHDISLSSFSGFCMMGLDRELENYSNKKRKYVMPTMEENELEQLEFELTIAEGFVQEVELAVEMRPNSLTSEMKDDGKTKEEKIDNDLFWEMLLTNDDWTIWTEGSEGYVSQI